MIWMLMLGMATGMRSMTALAVLCWCAWLGMLPETGWAAWAASLVAAIAFGLCAVAEYAGDLSPRAPSRTTMFPLTVRLIVGVVVGVLSAHALGEPIAGGVIFGVIGVLVGAYGGVWVRVWLAKKVGRDWPVGLTGSAIALGLALLAVLMMQRELAYEAAALKAMVM